MNVRTIKPQVGCVAGLTSIFTASAHQGFPDFHRVLPLHLFPVSFPNQSHRTWVFQAALFEHAFAIPALLFWDCPVPHGSIIPMSCSSAWQAGNCRAVGQTTPLYDLPRQPRCCSAFTDTSNCKPTGSLSPKYSASTPLPVATQGRGKLFQ